MSIDLMLVIGIAIMVLFGLLMVAALHGEMPPLSELELEDLECEQYWEEQMQDNAKDQTAGTSEPA